MEVNDEASLIKKKSNPENLWLFWHISISMFGVLFYFCSFLIMINERFWWLQNIYLPVFELLTFRGKF
jgi:hypothetical protein